MSKAHITNRARWQRLRNKVLKQYNHLCSNPFKLHNDIITPAEEVHHILPAEAYPQYFFDINNLLPLCTECHKHAHHLLHTDPRSYYENFDAYLTKGVSKSLHPFAPTPQPRHLPRESNEKGVDFEAKKEETKCFYDGNKCKYFCACLRQYRQYPCSKCSNLTKIYG